MSLSGVLMVTRKLCKYAEICSMFSEVKKLCTHNVWQASILKILPGPERPAALCFDNNENRNNVLPRSGPRGEGGVIQTIQSLCTALYITTCITTQCSAGYFSEGKSSL